MYILSTIDYRQWILNKAMQVVKKISDNDTIWYDKKRYDKEIMKQYDRINSE